MPLYRKKPVVVEAQKLQTVDYDGWLDTIQWASARAVGEEEHSTAVAVIDTLEGPMFAEPGDYIIQGVKGEFYPCKPDIFLLTHDPVEEEPIVRPAEPLPDLPDGMAWLDVRLLVRTDSLMNPEDVQRDVLDAVGRALRDRGLATVRG